MALISYLICASYNLFMRQTLSKWERISSGKGHKSFAQEDEEFDAMFIVDGRKHG